MKKTFDTLAIFLALLSFSSCNNSNVSDEGTIRAYGINHEEGVNLEEKDYFTTIGADTMNVVCQLSRIKRTRLDGLGLHKNELGLQMNVLCNSHDNGPCERSLFGGKKVNYKIPSDKQLIKIYEVIFDSIHVEYDIHNLSYVDVPTLNMGKTLLDLSDTYQTSKILSDLEARFRESEFFSSMTSLMAKYGKKVQNIRFEQLNPISRKYYRRFNRFVPESDNVIPDSILHTYIVLSVE